jgi:hypothetical protein
MPRTIAFLLVPGMPLPVGAACLVAGLAAGAPQAVCVGDQHAQVLSEVLGRTRWKGRRWSASCWPPSPPGGSRARWRVRLKEAHRVVEAWHTATLSEAEAEAQHSAAVAVLT